MDMFEYTSKPSWGMIGASQCSGSPNLFQCDVLPHNFVRVTIKQAEKTRDLHRDWVHGRNTICEVILSPTQWAEFLTTMNCGDGVPCTIRYTQQDGVIEHEQEHNHLDLLIEEGNQKVDSTMNSLRQLVKDLDALIDNKKISKSLGAELQYKVSLAISNLDGENAKFFKKKIKEEVNSYTQQAKANIQAFVDHKIYSTGLQELQKQASLPLTESEQQQLKGE
jgi:hypothetical protein